MNKIEINVAFEVLSFEYSRRAIEATPTVYTRIDWIKMYLQNQQWEWYILDSNRKDNMIGSQLMVKLTDYVEIR